MMTYVNMSSEGLVVLATHRVLAGLAGFDAAAVRSRASADFDITRLDSPSELKMLLPPRLRSILNRRSLRGRSGRRISSQ